MTKPIGEMTQQELIWAIEGYARNARKAMDEGRDPEQTLSRIRSQIDRYLELAQLDTRSSC
jgi:hypothetical protein